MIDENHLSSDHNHSNKTNQQLPQNNRPKYPSLKASSYPTSPHIAEIAKNLGVYTVDSFNKVLVEMTMHTFPTYTFYKQKKNLRGHLITPRNMKLRIYISKLQEQNVYLGEYPLYTPV